MKSGKADKSAQKRANKPKKVEKRDKARKRKTGASEKFIIFNENGAKTVYKSILYMYNYCKVK